MCSKTRFLCHTVSFFRRYFKSLKDKILISRYLGETRKLNYFSFSKRNSSEISRVEINIAFRSLLHNKLQIAIWCEIL